MEKNIKEKPLREKETYYNKGLVKFVYRGIIADLGKEAAWSDGIMSSRSDNYYTIDILLKRDDKVLVYRDAAKFSECRTRD